jgi:hypothetical protein
MFSAGPEGSGSDHRLPFQLKRMLRSNQRLRVIGALVEIRSIPVVA